MGQMKASFQWRSLLQTFKIDKFKIQKLLNFHISLMDFGAKIGIFCHTAKEIGLPFQVYAV